MTLWEKKQISWYKATKWNELEEFVTLPRDMQSIDEEEHFQ